MFGETTSTVQQLTDSTYHRQPLFELGLDLSLSLNAFRDELTLFEKLLGPFHLDWALTGIEKILPKPENVPAVTADYSGVLMLAKAFKQRGYSAYVSAFMELLQLWQNEHANVKTEHLGQLEILHDYVIATQPIDPPGCTVFPDTLTKSLTTVQRLDTPTQLKEWLRLVDKYQQQGYNDIALYLATAALQKGLHLGQEAELLKIIHRLSLLEAAIRENLRLMSLQGSPILYSFVQQLLDAGDAAQFLTAATTICEEAVHAEQAANWPLAFALYQLVLRQALQAPSAGLHEFVQSSLHGQLMAGLVCCSTQLLNQPVSAARWLHYRYQLQQLRLEAAQTLMTPDQSVFQAQQRYGQGLRQLLADILKVLEDVLSEPPCSFAVIGMGSLSRDDLGPYSDLDLAVLVCKDDKDPSSLDKYRNHGYFQRLISYLAITLQSLGDPWILQGKQPISLGLQLDRGNLEDLLGDRQAFKNKTLRKLIHGPTALAQWVVETLLENPTGIAATTSPSKLTEAQVHAHALLRPVLIYSSQAKGEIALHSQYLTALKIRLEGSLHPPLSDQQCIGLALFCKRQNQYQSNFEAVMHPSVDSRAATATPLDIKKTVIQPLQYAGLETACYHGLQEPTNQGLLRRLPDILAALRSQQWLAPWLCDVLQISWEAGQRLRWGLQLYHQAQMDTLPVNSSNALPGTQQLKYNFTLVHTLQQLGSFLQLILYHAEAKPLLQQPETSYDPIKVWLTHLTDDKSKDVKQGLKAIANLLALSTLLLTNTPTTLSKAWVTQQLIYYRCLPEQWHAPYYDFLKAAFNNLSSMPFTLEAKMLSEAVLTTLAQWPKPDGARLAYAQEMLHFCHSVITLSGLLQTEVASGFEKVRDAICHEQGRVTTVHYTDETGTVQKAILEPELTRQMLDSEGNFKRLKDGHGGLLYAGRHAIIPYPLLDQPPVIYLKQWAEMPAIEATHHRLS
jgi:Putative nucleotidyltransferase DUF294